RDVAVQASGCVECLSLALAPEDNVSGVCVRCEQVNDLLCLVAELKEDVERLRSIRDSESEIDWWSCTLSNPKEVQEEMGKPSLFCHQAVGANQVDGGEWKQVPHWRGKRIPSQPPPTPQVPLKNRHEALDSEKRAEDRQEEDLSGRCPICPPSTRWVTTTATKKKRRVVVVGDSLLRGTEGPICRPDPSHRDVCCLSGAWVRDISRRLSQLIRPSDYYPLLVVQAGTDDSNGRSTKAIKKDFKALGHLVDGSGAQGVCTSEMNEERSRKTYHINRWLRDWCHQWNFRFFEHGPNFIKPSLFKPDGLHLSSRGKRTLAYKLAGLIKRALN
ncbi:hypothetical protein N300_01915, partial [Calypte anna]